VPSVDPLPHGRPKLVTKFMSRLFDNQCVGGTELFIDGNFVLVHENCCLHPALRAAGINGRLPSLAAFYCSNLCVLCLLLCTLLIKSLCLSLGPTSYVVLTHGVCTSS